MPTSSDLTDFLLARIAEDESAARNRQIENVPLDCWGPERVLAECEAKRRIVERYTKARQTGSSESWGLTTAMFDLATVYADHPDYKQEWCL